MSKAKIGIIIAMPAIVAIAGLCIFNFSGDDPPAGPKKIPAIGRVENDIANAPSTDFFYPAIQQYPPLPKSKGVSGILGGIAPHHDLASPLIAELFQRLAAGHEPKTIIILAPNHSDIGVAPAITGRIDWQTDFGLVDNNRELLGRVMSLYQIAYDEDNYLKEHAIRVWAPFVKYYLPNTQIVPILISSKFGYRESLAFAEELSLILDENKDVVLLANLDFSHYLSAAEAEERDKVTRQAIENRDYEAISRFSNDYVDSPLTLVIFLRTMELAGAGSLDFLDHKNSVNFLPAQAENTTSYFTAFFRK